MASHFASPNSSSSSRKRPFRSPSNSNKIKGLTYAIIQELAAVNSYERGVALRNTAHYEIDRNKRQILGAIEGKQYDIIIDYEEPPTLYNIDCSCTCPDKRDGCCKHAVAVLLHCVDATNNNSLNDNENGFENNAINSNNPMQFTASTSPNHQCYTYTSPYKKRRVIVTTTVSNGKNKNKNKSNNKANKSPSSSLSPNRKANKKASKKNKSPKNNTKNNNNGNVSNVANNGNGFYLGNNNDSNDNRRTNDNNNNNNDSNIWNNWDNCNSMPFVTDALNFFDNNNNNNNNSNHNNSNNNFDGNSGFNFDFLESNEKKTESHTQSQNNNFDFNRNNNSSNNGVRIKREYNNNNNYSHNNNNNNNNSNDEIDNEEEDIDIDHTLIQQFSNNRKNNSNDSSNFESKEIAYNSEKVSKLKEAIDTLDNDTLRELLKKSVEISVESGMLVQFEIDKMNHNPIDIEQLRKELYESVHALDEESEQFRNSNLNLISDDLIYMIEKERERSKRGNCKDAMKALFVIANGLAKYDDIKYNVNKEICDKVIPELAQEMVSVLCKDPNLLLEMDICNKIRNISNIMEPKGVTAYKEVLDIFTQVHND